MRRLTASFFISLDGVVEAPQNWHFPYFNDEMGAVVGEAIAASDAFLLGRRTYEEWAAFWPTEAAAESPMAGPMNATPKHVVSTTLDKVEWQNSTLLEGDLAKAVTELKAKPGKNIGMSGSATLVRSLLELGLVDELRLLVHPLVVGSGAKLFENGTASVSLELVDSRTFSTGVVDLTYRPVAA
ncbi:MAG TPA: dihydrofolate reductase family protein [Gaiellaceae bacterium]|jgi:dihydrofolate reductase